MRTIPLMPNQHRHCSSPLQFLAAILRSRGMQKTHFCPGCISRSLHSWRFHLSSFFTTHRWFSRTQSIFTLTEYCRQVVAARGTRRVAGLWCSGVSRQGPHQVVFTHLHCIVRPQRRFQRKHVNTTVMLPTEKSDSQSRY